MLKRIFLILALSLRVLSASAADTPEDVFWKSVSKSDVAEEYRLYVEQYPKGKYVGQARAAIEAMEASRIPPDPAETAFWADVKANKQKAYYVAYLEQFPRGRHVAEAKRALALFEADERQAQARADELRRASETKAAADAKRAVEQAEQEKVRVELTDWEGAKALNTWPGYAEFIGKHSNGRFVTLAKLAQSKLPLQPGMTFKDCADCPEMVMIPAGSFEMGSNSGESDGRPVHHVSLNVYAMGKTEVTQGQWRAVMGNNPSDFSNCGDGCPVEKVSWNDAKEFIQKLNAKTGKTYRLPSEAEWEYACRAGGTQTYCGGENIDSVARYSSNSVGKTYPVAGKEANAWGLYDMSGSVWEWVEDCWNANYNGAPSDGSAWTSGACGQRVIRGGSWFSGPQLARAASRSRYTWSNRYNNNGFRLVRTLP